LSARFVFRGLSVMTKNTSQEDRGDRAYRLVGKFMSDWAFLEYELNQGIRRLADLGTLETVAITANMQVRDKIHALKTLLNLFHPEDDAADIDSLMTKIGNMAGDRNTLAHTMFYGHEKGVELSMTKAKGKLQATSVIWPTKQFAEKGARMAELSVELRRAVAAAAGLRSRWLSHQASTRAKAGNIFATGGMFNALRPPAEPMSGLYSLGLLADPNLPLPTRQNSRTASPEKAPRKPRAKKATTPKTPRPKAKGKRRPVGANQ
jgi:hypothetical protein